MDIYILTNTHSNKFQYCKLNDETKLNSIPWLNNYIKKQLSMTRVIDEPIYNVSYMNPSMAWVIDEPIYDVDHR